MWTSKRLDDHYALCIGRCALSNGSRYQEQGQISRAESTAVADEGRLSLDGSRPLQLNGSASYPSLRVVRSGSGIHKVACQLQRPSQIRWWSFELRRSQVPSQLGNSAF